MISIATVSLKDIPRLKLLAVKTFQESHGHSAPGHDIRAYLERCFNQRVLEAELKEKKNLFFLIHAEEKTAGYSKMALNCTCPQVDHPLSTKLERLYLLAAFHGQRLGQQLLQFNIDLSRKMGQTGMWLYVWKENEKAIRFYELNGFRKAGEHEFRVSETHSNPNYIMYLKY